MQFAALVACVSLVHCEWVEISQHYHRPRKPTHYTNTTNREHAWGQISNNWHQTSNKYDAGDDIERWTTKPDDIVRKPTTEISGENKKPVASTTAGEDSGEVTRTEIPVAFVKDGPGPTRAIIEKVSNLGSVKRVQLPNTPIKSPTIKISDRNTYNTPVRNQDSDEFVNNANIFKHEEVMSTNNGRQNLNKERPNTNVDNRNQDNSQSYSNISKDTDLKHDPNLNGRIDTKDESKMNSNIIKTKNINNTDIKKVKNQISIPENVKNNVNIQNKNSLYDPIDHHQFTIEADQDFKYPDDKTSNQNDQSNEVNVNTIDNILKFMKIVTETISKNVKRGVNGKVKYLSELRDSMLQNIKYRIDLCWPDDSPAGQLERGRRRSRAATGAARGHVEFPSSDSALMTISFLTFAVFLIKLVLQVIQAYKNKAMIMAPVMVATAGRRRLARKEGKH